MRTVSNVGVGKKNRLEGIDKEKIIAASHSRNTERRIVFYDPFAEKGARFTKYVEDSGSKFISSMQFENNKEK